MKDTDVAIRERMSEEAVTILGLGGLGSNVAVALARMNIGVLFLVDYKEVKSSHLYSQQYLNKHIGIKKTDALREVIYDINEKVVCFVRDERITNENILDMCSHCNIIVDALERGADQKMLIQAVLDEMPDKTLISASGFEGIGNSNDIITKKINNHFYQVLDSSGTDEKGIEASAPRVLIAAGHQANKVIELIVNNSIE